MIFVALKKQRRSLCIIVMICNRQTSGATGPADRDDRQSVSGSPRRASDQTEIIRREPWRRAQSDRSLTIPPSAPFDVRDQRSLAIRHQPASISKITHRDPHALRLLVDNAIADSAPFVSFVCLNKSVSSLCRIQLVNERILFVNSIGILLS